MDEVIRVRGLTKQFGQLAVLRGREPRRGPFGVAQISEAIDEPARLHHLDMDEPSARCRADDIAFQLGCPPGFRKIVSGPDLAAARKEDVRHGLGSESAVHVRREIVDLAIGVEVLREGIAVEKRGTGIVNHEIQQRQPGLGLAYRVVRMLDRETAIRLR